MINPESHVQPASQALVMPEFDWSPNFVHSQIDNAMQYSIKEGGTEYMQKIMETK